MPVRRAWMRYQLLSLWPAEARDFLVAVERAGRLIRAARHGIGDAKGLTFAGWRLLKFISISRKHSMAAIARDLRVSRQAIHTLAHRLQSAGCLALVRNPPSFKAIQPVLTREGASRLAAAEETLRTALHEVVNDLSQETLVTGAGVLDRFSGRLRRCVVIMRRRPRPRPRKHRP